MDPGTRSDNLAGAFVGGGATALGGSIGLGFVLATVAPLALAVVGGLALGSAMGAGVAAAVGSHHRNRLVQVQAEMEGILDRLEAGESLEPPPPSWRRWVQRHFHGARRLLDELGDDEDTKFR